MTAPMTDLDARARECGCPPQVEMCAHFEGRVVVLSSAARHSLRVRQRHSMTAFGVDYSIEGLPRFCGCGCGWQGFQRHSAVLFHGDSHDLALAAFEEACERLRAGVLA